MYLMSEKYIKYR